MWFDNAKTALYVRGNNKSHRRKFTAGMISLTLIAIALLIAVVNPNLVALPSLINDPTARLEQRAFYAQNAKSNAALWEERPQWEKRRLSRFAQKNLSSWASELKNSHPQSIALVQERMAEIETLLQSLEVSFDNPTERPNASRIKRQIRDQERQLLQDIEALLEASPSIVEKLIVARSLKTS